jgi:hypothetical protein
MKSNEKIGILLHQSHYSIVPKNTALLFPNLLYFILPKSLYFFFLFTSVCTSLFCTRIIVKDFTDLYRFGTKTGTKTGTDFFKSYFALKSNIEETVDIVSVQFSLNLWPIYGQLDHNSPLSFNCFIPISMALDNIDIVLM